MATPPRPDRPTSGTASPGTTRYEADTGHLVRASVLVSGLALVWKALGLLRETASAAIFGATRLMDAFVVAKTIPDMVTSWVEVPVRSAMIPLFSRRLHQSGEADAWHAASNIINCVVVFLVPLVAVLFIGSEVVVRILSTGFRNATAWDESAQFARILALSILFSVMAVILGSLSNVYRRQAVPALGRVLNGAIVLGAVVLLGPRIGPGAYAWGMLAGAVVYMAVQLDVIWRHRRHYNFRVDPFAPEIREMLVLAFPLFIGLTGTRIDVLLDRNFASFLPEGSLAILAYGTMLSAVATDLLLLVAQSVFLPHFAQLHAEGRLSELRQRLLRSIGGYLFLTLPVTVIVAVGARPLVNLVYAHGRFTSGNAHMTAIVLTILALGDPVFGIGQLLAQVHISGGDTKTPMKVGFWRIGFKAVASVALLPFIGVFGLAAATAVSSVVRTTMLWRALPSAVKPRASDLLREARYSIVPALVAAAAVWVANWALPDPRPEVGDQLLHFGCAAAAGAIAYVLMSFRAGNTFATELLEKARAAFVRRPR